MKEIKLTPNNRYLFNYVWDIDTIREATLVEISPSGRYYNFSNPTGDSYWAVSLKVNFLEDLGPDPRGIPNPEYQKAPCNVYIPAADRPYEPLNVGPPPKPLGEKPEIVTNF